MTRKDYVTIAEAIKRASDEATDSQRDGVRIGAFWAAHFIAHALRRDNPRFERARFMEAAGFPVGE
jgi:hypothetical protein